MSSAPVIKGSCLCGEVSFEIVGKIGPIGQCHCSKCRKASGTDGNAVFHTAAKSLQWTEGTHLVEKYVDRRDQSWGRSFCRKCASPLPHISSDKKFYFVPAGSLDTDPGSRGYAVHIFVESKAPWVMICDKAPQHSEGFDSPLIND